MTEEVTSFWADAWAWIKRAARAIAAPLPAILLVVGAVVLVALGVKNLQIGGLLGKLLGKEPPKGPKAVDAANSIPEDRVDPNGHVIPIGAPDSQGQTQAKVVPIESGGLFDRDDQVKIVPPNASEPVVVNLPDGVKAKDVDKVILVQPEVYVVTVHDSSKVAAKDIDDLLLKYGSGK